jgi:hypothetical protein
VLDELRPSRSTACVVVIGVHSPVEHEKHAAALAAAVERAGVEHPVLDDPDPRRGANMRRRYGRRWRGVDPEGYVVASMAGEGHAEGSAAWSRS